MGRCTPRMELSVIVAALFCVIKGGGASHGFTLNLALHPSINGLTHHLGKSLQHMNITLNRRLLPEEPHGSDYRSILSVLQVLQNHSTHIVIGPFYSSVAIATDELDIAYLSTSEVPTSTFRQTFQLPPRPEHVYQAVYEYMVQNNWDVTNVFFHEDKDRAIVRRFVANHDLTFRTWRLPEETDGSTKDVLIYARTQGIKRSIVFCSRDRLVRFLKIDDEFGDILDEFSDSFVNFTLFSTVRFTTWKNSEHHDKTLGHAVIQDAFGLLVRALMDIREYRGYKRLRETLLFSISNIQYEGVTGRIEFDGHQKRDNLTVYFTEVSSWYRRQLGVWMSGPVDTGGKFELRTGIVYNTTRFLSTMEGRMCAIVTILERPFCMLKKDHRARVGVDRFEGFTIDLMRELSAMLKFNYTVYLVHDGQFGSKRPDGSWTGIIGEVLAGNACMSLAPLSVNAEREEAVDFTKPFMSRSLSAIIKAPTTENAFFQFLKPVHYIVWLCVLGSVIVISILLYIFERVSGRLTPDGKPINISESVWLVLGSLLRADTGSRPMTRPGRILTAFWWFFAFILICSYTANLAAFLTVKSINVPIETILDLAAQKKIHYGTVINSGVMRFFQNTEVNYMSKMWSTMSAVERDGLVTDSYEGLSRVRNGEFALFWDSTVIRYETNKDCSLMEIGPSFDHKGYGIALPPASVYRETLSMAILKLSDNGTLQALENKWWSATDCGPAASVDTGKLPVENVAGIFFILVVGASLSGIVCYVERTLRKLSERWKKKRTHSVDTPLNDQEKRNIHVFGVEEENYRSRMTSE